MPDSCSSRGVWMLPSARITSRARYSVKPVPVRTRTPTTASPSNNRFGGQRVDRDREVRALLDRVEERVRAELTRWPFLIVAIV